MLVTLSISCKASGALVPPGTPVDLPESQIDQLRKYGVTVNQVVAANITPAELMGSSGVMVGDLDPVADAAVMTAEIGSQHRMLLMLNDPSIPINDKRSSLEFLPHIGPARARRILDQQPTDGYVALDEIQAASGLSDESWADVMEAY